MNLSTEAQAFKDYVNQANSIVILLPETAGRDGVAAGLALYLSLNQLGKSVSIVYPKPAVVGWSHLVGINKLSQNLGNKNFVISLDYIEGSIEKVSYNIDNNKFNLVIEPRPGAPLLDSKRVSYNYTGLTAELIITVAANSRESLGKYYTDNKQLFDEKPVVVIDNRINNAQFGKLNFVRPQASISEMVALLLQSTQLPVDMDTASNLYDGITYATRNFTIPQINADTFEAAAFCLKMGGKKTPVRQEETPNREFGVTRPPDAPQPPPDWMKPKIYKGSQLL